MKARDVVGWTIVEVRQTRFWNGMFSRFDNHLSMLVLERNGRRRVLGLSVVPTEFDEGFVEASVYKAKGES